MNLIRYRSKASCFPAFSHGTLLDELDRLFAAGFPESRQHDATPVDIFQSKDGVTVRVEVPGFRKEDLQIDVADDVLTISGQAAPAADEKENPKRANLVQRRIAVPENLDVTKITAAYENGVLTVTVPAREETKPTHIAVEIK